MNHTQVGVPSPNPDYPQAIEQVDSVKLQYTGSNLFDYTKISTASSSTSGLVITLGENGDITVSGKLKYSYASVVLMQDITDILEDGETYYINQSNHNNFVYLEVTITKNDDSIVYLGTQVGERSFIVDKTNFKKYTIKVICCRLATWGDEEKTITSNFKLTRQKSVPFEKYQNQAINIDLKDNKICAISDTIKDKLLIDRNGNVALQKNIQKTVLDGTQKWTISTAYTNDTYLCAFLSHNVAGIQTTIMINDSFPVKDYTQIDNIECLKASGQFNLRIKKDRLQTPNIEGLIAYLKEHNITAYNPIIDPELIDLGQLTELPKTFNGINNIWVETNLGNTQIKIEYVQDVKKLIENLQALALDNATIE